MAKSLAHAKRALVKQAPATWGDYDGRLPQGTVDHPSRAGIVLVPLDRAPDHRSFPAVRVDLVPPQTYYAYDTLARRVTHMVSLDATGVPVAWDTDRDGRYFLRAGRALIAPRYVEYCWDSSKAMVDGEDWGVLHPAYKGSLGSRPAAPGGYDDAESPLIRALHRARTGPVYQDMGADGKLLPPKPRKKSLRAARPAPVTVDDDGILTDRGLDQAKLHSAAGDMAGKYADVFGGAKRKKSLRKFSK